MALQEGTCGTAPGVAVTPGSAPWGRQGGQQDPQVHPHAFPGQGQAGTSCADPRGLWEGLYLLLVADVSRGGFPGDGGDGIPRGLAGQCDLILQLHGCLVLHVRDFGFG